jgi:hypothetical protein
MTDAAQQPLEPIPQTSSASKSVSNTTAVNPADHACSACYKFTPANK